MDRNLRMWLRAVGADLFVIACAIWADFAVVIPLLESGYVLWGALLFLFVTNVLVGTRLHGIAFLAHDGAHGLASDRRWVNELVSHAAFVAVFGATLEGYRRFHNTHHKKVGTADDPELTHVHHRLWGQWQLPLKLSRLGWLLLLDLLIVPALPHLGMVIKLTEPKKKLCIVRNQLILWAIFSTCVALGIFGVVPRLWALPIIWYAAIGPFWACFRVRIYAEHVGANHTHRFSLDGVLGFVLKYLVFLHNSDHHWEHHVAFDQERRRVAFWQLPIERANTRDPRVRTLHEQIALLKRTKE